MKLKIPAIILRIFAGIFIFIALYGLAFVIYLGSNMDQLSKFGMGALTGSIILLLVGISGFLWMRKLLIKRIP